MIPATLLSQRFLLLGQGVWAEMLWGNLLDRLVQQATLLVIKLLIVAGAYLVGSVLGGILAVALARWVFRKRMPEAGRQLCSLIGGVLLALLAVLFLLGSGGDGLWGGGGGSGEGQGEGAASPYVSPSGNRPSAPQETREIPSPTAPEPPPPREVSAVLRVTVLAGKAVREAGRFYVLDDDPNPRTFSEITEAILQRRSRTQERLTVQILFPVDPNLAPPPNDPKVTRLTEWVRQEAGLDVAFPSRPR